MSFSLGALESYMKQNNLSRLEIKLDNAGNSSFVMFNNEGAVEQTINEQRFTKALLTLTAL